MPETGPFRQFVQPLPENGGGKVDQLVAFQEPVTVVVFLESVEVAVDKGKKAFFPGIPYPLADMIVPRQSAQGIAAPDPLHLQLRGPGDYLFHGHRAEKASPVVHHDNGIVEIILAPFHGSFAGCLQG